jgi:hypothetical protein
LCSSLAACTVASPAPTLPSDPSFSTQAALSGQLVADRSACNTAYPPKIGNYLPHAECVNAAVEHDALPNARYPDLVRLQEELRVSYSAQIDNGSITPRTGETKMAKADESIAAAVTERDAGRSEVANNQVTQLQTETRR